MSPKALKKMMKKLQDEMSTSVLQLLQSSPEPLDLTQIIELYPDNERRRSCQSLDELKRYISIGLGKLIEDKKVTELPQSSDGRFLLKAAV